MVEEFTRVARRGVVGRGEVQYFARRHRCPHATALKEGPDVDDDLFVVGHGIKPSYAHLTRRRTAKAQEGLGRGGLPRTIGTEQDGRASKIDGKADPANGRGLPEGDLDVADFYGMTHVANLVTAAPCRSLRV